MNIEVRPAIEIEKLNIDSVALADGIGTIPDGVKEFDPCDCEYLCNLLVDILCKLNPGDWIITICDPLKQIRHSITGTFAVQLTEDGGYYRQIDA